MAKTSLYLFQTHSQIMSEDLPFLPSQLRKAFLQEYRLILTMDPYGCNGYPNHKLMGRLRNYRTLEIDWEGISYRLVYRVYETPAPKRVFVISFAEHDPAYEKAKQRTGRND